jgi:short-subunit dehydrogenase
MSKLPVVMITGASSGIGATYADRFSKRGHDLTLVSNEPDRLALLSERLANRDGTTVNWISADLTLEQDVALVEKRIHEDESIGVLVNNAGGALTGTTMQNSREKLLKLVQLNCSQVALLSAAAGTAFGARESGSIVNIASVMGLAAMPQIAPSIYSGTMAFVIMFTQSLRAELAEADVYVQCVLPGATRTEIFAKSGMNADDVPGLMEVGDLVDAALLGFDRREAVTIPTLTDEQLWTTYEATRQSMLPSFLDGHLADRYRSAVDA